MNITPQRSYRYGNYSYSQIAPPFQNTAEITMGMMKNPTPDPLYISNTVYGTNANNKNCDDRYVTSAEYLVNYNKLNQKNIPDNVKMPVDSTVNIQNENYKTQITHLTEANNKYLGSDPAKQYPQIEALNSSDSIKYAAVNAKYNVNLSSEGKEALSTINSHTAQAIREEQDLSNKIDGYININPAMIKAKTSESKVEANLMKNAQDFLPTIIKPITNIFSSRTSSKVRKESLEQTRQIQSHLDLSA